MKVIIANDKERVGPWVCERAGGKWAGNISEAIGLEQDGELIAGAIFDGYNGVSMTVHLAGEGNWLNREYMRVCFDYAFNQCKINKLIGIVGSGNKQALKFDRHIGFVDEYVIKDAHPDGDLVILSMTKAQCRYLTPSGVKEQNE